MATMGGPTTAEITALAQAAVAAEIGGGQWDDRIEPLPAWLASTNTTAAFLANGVYLFRFRVEKEFPLNKIGLVTGATVAGNVDLGISTSTDFITYTPVVRSGPVAAPSANAYSEIAMTAPYDLVPDTDYWMTMGLTDATLTLLRVGASSAATFAAKSALVKTSAWSSGIPASVTSPTGNNAIPYFALVS